MIDVRNAFATGVAVCLAAAAPIEHPFAQPAAAPAPLIKQNAAMRVSEHVHVILDDNVGFVPNVGIVVGERATLIVDTGLGERNGAIVLQEARKLSDNTQFYLTATHFHPEHDLGATAFPPSATMVRSRSQQAEADDVGAETIERFAGFSPVVAELLDGARFRPVDVLFDDEITIDLGGVRVRLIGVGPNHTLGDTVMFVEEDRVLFTGDVVMSVFPAVSGASGSLSKWLANLATFEALAPATVVPAHGRLGDIAFIRRYRDYLGAVRARTLELKARGTTLADAQAALAPALAQEFAALQPTGGGPATGRINAAIQAAYREATDETADLAAIAAFNERYLGAINAEDIAALSALTTNGHIMLPPGRPPVVGKAANDESNGRAFRQFDFDETWTPVETEIAGDWAFQRGTFSVKSTPRAGGDTRTVTGNFLRIYERQPNGDWRMIRDMFNSDQSPASP